MRVKPLSLKTITVLVLYKPNLSLNKRYHPTPEYPIKFNLPVGELLFSRDTSPAFIAELLNGLTHEQT